MANPLNSFDIQRHTYLLIWVSCCLLMVVALYMQYQMGLIPCALCMTQRVFIIAIGVTALIAWVHKPKRYNYIYPVMGIIFAVVGGAFSSRHVWLQSLPADLVPACGPSLGYLLNTVPLMETLSVLLQGDGNCAESVWSFLGLTIPAWTLVAFIGLFSLNGFILFKKMKSPA